MVWCQWVCVVVGVGWGVFSVEFIIQGFFFFFSSRRRHTRCREVSWARRCVQETGSVIWFVLHNFNTPLFRHNFKNTIFTFCLPMYSALIPVSYTHLTLPTILLVQISVVAVSLKKKNSLSYTYYQLQT
eukprot:TRINITY_DN21816_c0_g1_i5.p1 TRINITY_DN21816_c0_g1~~TRINITY_DN21816_c0_g1_i5.p1  ORF type:complete len:129 (-),score=27.63 TRINITY_DN21816_c0_g1_i5:85-471(-)